MDNKDIFEQELSAKNATLLVWKEAAENYGIYYPYLDDKRIECFAMYRPSTEDYSLHFYDAQQDLFEFPSLEAVGIAVMLCMELPT